MSKLFSVLFSLGILVTPNCTAVTDYKINKITLKFLQKLGTKHVFHSCNNW